MGTHFYLCYSVLCGTLPVEAVLPLLPSTDGGRESVTATKRHDPGVRPSLSFRQTQALQLAKKYCQDVTMKAVSVYCSRLYCGNV